MAKQWQLIILSLIIYSCDHSTKKNQVFEVEYKGALKNIMHKGDLSSTVSLSSFNNLKNFYALGAMENLQGEIQIFDSEPYNSYVEEGELKFDKSYSRQATLLVYSTVESWIPVQIPNEIVTLNELEEYVEQAAKKHHINTKQPFPFLIEGVAKEVSWHVINWKDGDTEHSHEKHISSGLNGTITNEAVALLGFYSDSHHAIFTHHTTNMHIHVKLVNGEIAGHADDIKLGENMMLKLPKTE